MKLTVFGTLYKENTSVTCVQRSKSLFYCK